MISKFTVFALLLCYCGTVEAYGSLRCKGKIISPGVTMTKIMALCGPPKTRIIEQVPVRSRIVTGFSRFNGVSYTELWEYDRGWGKFPVVLRFQDEMLRRVEYRRYRSSAP